MKKKWISALLALVLTLSLVPAAQALYEVTAKPTEQKLYVMAADGVTTKEVVREFEIYNINHNNYMRIRDLGFLMDFQVQYNKRKGGIDVLKNKHNDNVQVSRNKAFRNDQAQLSGATIFVDGERVDGLTMYNIHANNYVKIRDLAEAVGFGCIYSHELKAVVLSPYYDYSENDVMTEGEKIVPDYLDGQENRSWDNLQLYE